MGNSQHGQAHSHPTPSTFYRIAAILFVITAIEFAIVYLKGIQGLIWAVLAVLSVVKFVLVAAYFMHLKFDPKVLRWVFAVGAVLGTAMTGALVLVNYF